MNEPKIQINSLDEMNLYLHARRNELIKQMNEENIQHSSLINWAKCTQIEELLQMINL